MRVLALDRLFGPGNSIDENFELLVLSLMKALMAPSDAVHCYRAKPPDDGIDVFDPKGRVALQCKAYSHFRPDLIRAVAASAERADSAYSRYKWESYGLAIPFVPTAKQREGLKSALEKCRGQHFIYDGDQIEALLYDFPKITERFFPTVSFVVPSPTQPLTLDTGSGRPLLSLRLISSKTGQAFKLSISPDAKVGGVVNFLVMTLKLPDAVTVKRAGVTIAAADITWTLSKASRTDLPLDSEASLEQCGIFSGDDLGLRYEFHVHDIGGFATRMGLPITEFHSSLWEDKDMVQISFDGREQEKHLSEFVDRSIRRVLFPGEIEAARA